MKMTAVLQLELPTERSHPSRVAERREQTAQIARVRGRIGQAVIEFARTRVGEFGIEELQRFVRERCAVAPSSPDRILRQLRREGVLDYECVSRSAALYRITRAPEVATTA